MQFVPGQQIVWSYRPRHTPRRICLVAGEVVSGAGRRIRIRVRTTQDTTTLRWVEPAYLRLKAPHEPLYCYPLP